MSTFFLNASLVQHLPVNRHLNIGHVETNLELWLKKRMPFLSF